MTPLVETLSISVRAGAARILDCVNLAVGAGERLAIVGPNGAGKSTLLRALSGEIRPRSGTVRLKGRDLSAYSPHTLAAHRAVLSQQVSVAFPFTVADIVRMGAGHRQGGAVDSLVEATLAEVDLAAFHGRVITTLSGGEQHRAHFARALVQLACGEHEHGPGLLLLDEPTASLDLRHQINFADSTRLRAKNGTAVVAVLHDLNLAMTFAERIVVLRHGAIAADGPASTIITGKLVEGVFGVASAVGTLPGAALPFVLPQLMKEAASGDRTRMGR